MIALRTLIILIRVRGMQSNDDLPFRLGPTIVADPLRNSIRRHGEAVSVEPRVMELLIYLAKRPGEIVTKRQLMDNVWRANVIDEAIHRAVSRLRSALGDPAQGSQIVETVPKRGYRLAVTPVLLTKDRWHYLRAAAVAAVTLSFVALAWAWLIRPELEPAAMPRQANPPVEVRYVDRPVPRSNQPTMPPSRDSQRRERADPQPKPTSSAPIAPQAPNPTASAADSETVAPPASESPTPVAGERP